MHQAQIFVDFRDCHLGIGPIQFESEIGGIFSDRYVDRRAVRIEMFDPDIEDLREKGNRHFDKFIKACRLEISQLNDGIDFGAILFEQPSSVLPPFAGGPAILYPCGLGKFADMKRSFSKAFRF